MRKGTQASPEACLANRLGRLKKNMPPEEFARFMEADGALKWCPKCSQLLPVGEFHKSRRTWDGLFQRCKACNSAASRDRRRRRIAEDPEYLTQLNQRSNERRAQAWAEGRYQEVARKHQRKTKYGLTQEAFEAMLAAQGYRCDICRKPFKGTRDTHIDHDHSCCPGGKSCGKCIRGILCGLCNNGLGRFRDNPAVLRRAARYVERHRARGNAAAPDGGQGLLWDESEAA